MPSVSKSQRKFFGFLKGNPSEAKKRGISGKVVDEYASTKEKGLPNKVGKGSFKAPSKGMQSLNKKNEMSKAGDSQPSCPTCGASMPSDNDGDEY